MTDQTPWLSHEGYMESKSIGNDTVGSRESAWQHELNDGVYQYTLEDGRKRFTEEELLLGRLGMLKVPETRVYKPSIGKEETDIPPPIADYLVNKEIFSNGLQESIRLFKTLYQIPQFEVSERDTIDFRGNPTKEQVFSETTEVGKVMWATCSVLEAFRRMTYVYDFEKLHGALYADGPIREHFMDDLRFVARNSAAVNQQRFITEAMELSDDDIDDALDRIKQLEASLLRIAGLTYMGESGASEVEEIVRKVIWQKWEPSFADFHIRYNFGKMMASRFYDAEHHFNRSITYAEAKEDVLERVGDFLPVDELPYLYRQFLSYISYVRYSDGRRKPSRIRSFSRLLTQEQIDQYERDFGAIDDYPKKEHNTRTVQIRKNELINVLPLDEDEGANLIRFGPRKLLALVLKEYGYDPDEFFERYDMLLDQALEEPIPDGNHLGGYINIQDVRNQIAQEYGEEIVEAITAIGYVSRETGVDNAFREVCYDYSFRELTQFAHLLDPDLALVFMHRIGCFMDHHGVGEDQSLYAQRERIQTFCYLHDFSSSTYYRRLYKVIDLLKGVDPTTFIDDVEVDLWSYSKQVSKAIKEKAWEKKMEKYRNE